MIIDDRNAPYGRDQNAESHQGQSESQRPDAAERGQSRGERYDEAAGGGRGADSVSFDPDRDGFDELAEDQEQHQDRGQSEAEEEV